MRRCSRRLYYISIVTISILLFSCEKKVVDKQGLVKFIEEHKELSQVKEIGDIRVQIKYCPYQLLAQQELDAESKERIDTARVRMVEKKYSPQYYFRISFSKNNKEVIRELGSFSRYSEMLQVFSFGMGSYINATTNRKDTLELKDYAFEQTYGMSASNSILIAFDKLKLQEAGNIDINLGEFGLGLGVLKFTFKRRDIDNVPELAYSLP